VVPAVETMGNITMSYSPGRLKKRTKIHAITRNAAFATLFALVGLSTLYNTVATIFSGSTGVLDWLHVFSFMVVLLLVMAWLLVTYDELELLVEWLDPISYVPRKGTKEIAAIFVFAPAFAFLLWSTVNPISYSLMFLVFSVCAAIGWSMIDRDVHEAITHSRDRLRTASEENPKMIDVFERGLNVIQAYFLDRPHFLRHRLILCAISVSAVLSLLYWYTRETTYGIVAYAIVNSTIILSEFWIFYWRHERDCALRPLVAERDDNERPTNEADE
jgi:hypothetical protein